MTCLRQLDMRLKGPEAAAALAPALQRLTWLCSLNLQGGDLGPDGVAALAPALQQLTGLRQL
jgi:hypothetical protein